ncbi:hypothetical protein [Helicobacter suis]|uniref:hypothetical protein n=1 Tax=Helicobacter suis TaxID=104628 RepID=UPI0013D129F1|nr:hypothetical protein [Helicobacter suis]
MSSEYENGKESRQFAINDFAIFADSEESVIKIAKTKSEEQEKDSAQNTPTKLEELKINLNGNILKEFEKVLPKILKIVE